MKIQSYVKRSRRRVQTKRVRNRKNKTRRRNRKNHMVGGGLFGTNTPLVTVTAYIKNNTVNGKTYSGYVVPHGNGTMTYSNHDVYDGEFKCGNKFGNGTTTTTDGSTIHNGTFSTIRSKFNSALTNFNHEQLGDDDTLMKVDDLIFKSIGEYTGTVVPHGQGEMKSVDNKEERNGEFKCGELHNGTNTVTNNDDGNTNHIQITYTNGIQNHEPAKTWTVQKMPKEE
jgi:hypothetical protein